MLEEVLIQSLKQVGWALTLISVAYALSYLFHALKKKPVPIFIRFSGFHWNLHLSTPRFWRNLLVVGVLSALVPLFLLNVSVQFRELILSPNSPAGRIARSGLNFSAIMAALAYSFFQSSLAEEIIFRGLIGKRLVAWLGFKTGNIIQAIVFALMHLLILQMVFKGSVVELQVLSVTMTFLLGWYLGWYNERRAEGSIVPAWLMHGLGNFLGYLVVLYWVLQRNP